MQNAKGEHPPEPAPDFTLPWVERFCAQCRSPVGTAGTKIYNTPPSGKCTLGKATRYYSSAIAGARDTVGIELDYWA